MDIVKSSAKKAKTHQMYFVEVNGKKRRVPGVTTITGVMDKPALVGWANKLGLNGIDVKGYVDDLAGVGKCAHRMSELDCLGVKDPTRHEDMNEYTKDQIDLAMNGYLKFIDWKEKTGFVATMNEKQLVHDELFYGGTLDIIGHTTKHYSSGNTTLLAGTALLVDLKTSKALYGEHLTQVAGGYGLLADYNKISYDHVLILRIGRNPDEGFEERYVTQLEVIKHQKRFKACLALYECNKECNRKGA